MLLQGSNFSSVIWRSLGVRSYFVEWKVKGKDIWQLNTLCTLMDDEEPNEVGSLAMLPSGSMDNRKVKKDPSISTHQKKKKKGILRWWTWFFLIGRELDEAEALALREEWTWSKDPWKPDDWAEVQRSSVCQLPRAQELSMCELGPTYDGVEICNYFVIFLCFLSLGWPLESRDFPVVYSYKETQKLQEKGSIPSKGINLFCQFCIFVRFDKSIFKRGQLWFSDPVCWLDSSHQWVKLGKLTKWASKFIFEYLFIKISSYSN